MNDVLLTIILIVLKLGLVLGTVLTMAAYMVLAERKILGRMQMRYGPNRVGWGGMLQPLADLIKLLSKEDLIPEGADRWIFMLAPAISTATALLAFAVIPFGPSVQLFGRTVPLVICDLDIGVLYLFALSSLAVYGVALGGWASQSKYSLLGGLRAMAQMISYELAMGLAIAPVVMASRSFSLTAVVEAQQTLPNMVRHPLAFLIFLVAVMAESKRIPFDMPEAENELVAGYHTEYSGMRFGMFFVGEYLNLIVLGSMLTVLFLGGWYGPLLPGVCWFLIKVLGVAFFFIWVRGTLPRLRYDQLMAFGWKVLVPLGLLNLLITAAWMIWRG
ncbi:MAG: NADH-quinone oxidoreductase subunit [Desulfuromonadales bacterium]|jgi:NADH-quinone oxidoreductase subunit H|nr:NADH-quinone oxidoreductase subunit [Desulfuromonadales bacterium]